MKKIEGLFAMASPKILLDHYWNVLDLIAWRGFIESKGKEHFTTSDLADKLSEDGRSSKNPFYVRVCSRPIAIIEKVVSELVSLELLIKDRENLRKTDKFYCMLTIDLKTTQRARKL